MKSHKKNQKENFKEKTLDRTDLMLLDLLSLYVMLMDKGILSLKDVAENSSDGMTRLILHVMLPKKEN